MDKLITLTSLALTGLALRDAVIKYRRRAAARRVERGEYEKKMAVEATVVLLDSDGNEVSERIRTAVWTRTLHNGHRVTEATNVSFKNVEVRPSYWIRVTPAGGSECIVPADQVWQA